MINRIVLVGRLTKEPELRYTPNGVAVASFTLAVNRPFAKEGQQETDFLPIVVWRKQAENAANYLHKGSLAGVDGRVQTRNYENNEGRRVYVTEVLAESVQYLEPKGTNHGGQNSNNSNNGNSNASNGNGNRQNYNHQGRDQSGNFQDPFAGKGQNNDQPPKFEDPFANNSEPISISDDDLPF